MEKLHPLRCTICILCLIFSISYASAQYDPSKINKKTVEVYNKGLEKAQSGNYKEAIASFQEAIKREPRYIEAYLSLAGVFGELKDHEQSAATYEKAFALDSNFTSDLRLPYSINLAAMGQFEKALNTVNALLSRPNLGANTRKAAEYRRNTYQFAIDYARNNPYKDYVFNPVNMGDNINSAEAEYFPSMPIDGSGLVFTRRLNNFNEEFFLSENDHGTWRPAHRLTGSINTPQNEGAQMISQDGQWLVFTGCNRPDGNGSCDIYISYKTTSGWSEAVNLGSKVNSEQWDSQPCLSPDKRDLYFSSHRPGGLGGADIYVSHLQANGRWSEPENLGPQINTSGNEFSPFIHADNQTLYFTSTGWPGYGKEDLFVSHKGTDGKWSTPKNLGYPINTVNEEGSLFIAADGKTAFYASDRSQGKGMLDIYSFELRPDIRPAKTLWVKGKVYDKKTSAGLPSSVELIDLASKQTISKVQTDENGDYLITLPVGKDYAFNVARRGYLFYSDNYALVNKIPDSTYKKDIPLQPIEVNASVVLKNIFFDFNKYDLEPQSQAELDKVVQLLQENPSVKIQLEGHTDNIGNATDNLKLSENRAKAVVNYLIGKGIESKRLVAKGFGATQPIADNTTDEGRAQNRRTELKIVGK
ncbi:OmpA family protein [Chitinophagaceae bacterium LB-8]|uniref:OmpA family protein n=1 Tax=Paraflavisolibacter caeni TaxID=2982496 RepID=A0A9X2XX11_9BACT|nr:OmpA family protein [Paraflavisolibacter caeni]MCU7551044.1 OmpA family protein [Paraflavisolibacter caeni]